MVLAVAAFFAALLAVATQAGAGQQLVLDDLIAEAKRQNPEIQAARDRALAMASIPKVENSFRMIGYGSISPDSSASTWGRTSLSTNSRTASRTAMSMSDHSIMHTRFCWRT